MSQERSHAAVISVLEFWQSMISTVSMAYLMFVISNIVSLADCEDEGQDSMFWLYFEVMDKLDEDELYSIMHPGRGFPRFGLCAEENPLPKLNVCRFYKMMPDLFQTYCGLTPNEFDHLLSICQHQLLKPRNGFCDFSEAEQAQRKPQPYLRKLRPDEELFACLYYMRCYPGKGWKQMQHVFGWAGAATHASFRWFLRIFAHETDSPLADEIKWPTPEERDAQKAQLRAARVNEALLDIIGWVDGVKQLCQMNFRNQDQSKDSNFKGVGKNNLVFVDWIGKIIRVDCGFLGSENDRGMYNLTNVFRNWRGYLRPNETLGGDNIFNGKKGLGSRDPGVCPIHLADLFAPYNEVQLNENPDGWILNLLLHRYRVVVENSIGQIKQWRIVKDPYRGNIDDQPYLWLVASRLTAYIMRMRDTYPRGEKFLRGDMEQWEADLKDILWLDSV